MIINTISFNIFNKKLANLANTIAQSMGGYAIPAVKLITFDKELTPSMDFVFGNTVITKQTF